MDQFPWNSKILTQAANLKFVSGGVRTEEGFKSIAAKRGFSTATLCKALRSHRFPCSVLGQQILLCCAMDPALAASMITGYISRMLLLGFTLW